MNLKDISLNEFLKYKTMYYDKIDYSTIELSWKRLSQEIKLPYVIHLVGTNGKGSTGRFLSTYLLESNYKVLHYSSPHIKKFNERIWINGRNSLDEELNEAHCFLQEILELELLKKLTYFEYTTLLAFYLSKDLDYLVLEAGLGGEFDATNVVKNDLSLITTIDIDHEKFLGNSVEAIARTKMRSVDRKMLIGYQIHDEVYKTALRVKEELKEEFNRDIQIEKVENFNKYIFPSNFATYLQKNLYLVIKALEELNISIDINKFSTLKLSGRCEKIRPNITIDVGHNPLAARSLLNEFKNKKVTLVYNSYSDKDYKKVLEILKPIVKEIMILDLEDERIVNKNNLEEIIEDLNIIYTEFSINKEKEYLVFGSFLVVEKFLTLLGANEK